MEEPRDDPKEEIKRLKRLRAKHKAEAERELAEARKIKPARTSIGMALGGLGLGGLGILMLVAWFASGFTMSGWLLVFLGLVPMLVGGALLNASEEQKKADERVANELRRSAVDRALWKLDYSRNRFDQAIARVERGGGVPTAASYSRAIPQSVKIAVAIRDEGRCVECGSDVDLQYDHIIPFSRGGLSDAPDNIQLLCGSCNRDKGNRWIG